MRLIESESSKIECFNFHRISNKLVSLLYFNDRMIGGHVVENWEVVWFFIDVIDHVIGHLFSINNLSMEFTIPRGNSTVEIHVVFCEGARFIKARKLNHTSSDNFILRDTEDQFLL